MSFKQILEDYSKVITKEETDFQELSEIINLLQLHLTEIIKEFLEKEDAYNDLYHSNGISIGTVWAALCLDDIMRTKQISKGVYEAVNDKLAEKESPINILYAGTGPFATLVLPLFYYFKPSQFQLTLLEVNGNSYAALKYLFAQLNLPDFQIQFVKADATTYQLDEDYDLIISETMQNGLEKEPQVSIFFNLMNQSSKTTIFIPEKISLLLAVEEKTDSAGAFNYVNRKPVFEVSKDVYFPEGEERYDLNDLKFPKKKGCFQLSGNQASICLLTEIQAYKTNNVTGKESGLTIPITIYYLEHDKTINLNFESQYMIGESPKLDISWEKI